MRAIRSWAACLCAALLFAGRPGDAGAAVDALSVGPAPAQHGPSAGCAGAALSADEGRVVEWLVEQILSLAPDGQPAVEFTEAQVQAATGVEVAGLDAERVRRHVLKRLKAGSAPSATARPAASAAPAGRASAAGSASGCGETRGERSTVRASSGQPQGAPSAP
jgi:hypothetical protein